MSDRNPVLIIFLHGAHGAGADPAAAADWLAVARPNFLVLVILYWSTMVPRAGGMMLGFVGGLALDVLQGSVLGEHALALAFVTYLAIRLQPAGASQATIRAVAVCVCRADGL